MNKEEMMKKSEKLVHKTPKTLEDFREDLKSEYRFISQTSSTSGFAHIVATKNESFDHLNMFIVNTSDKYTVTVIIYSRSAYALIPKLGETYLSINPIDLLRCIPNREQDYAIAKQYLAANSDDLVGILSTVLKSQSGLIKRTQDDNERLIYDFKNLVPHVKKAYQVMIPKRFR